MEGTKNVFDYFGEPSKVKEKSYNLPLFHVVNYIRDEDTHILSAGDSLSEAV